MSHSEMDELYELFLLNALEAEQATEIEQHLRDNCVHCASKIAQARATIGVMGETLVAPVAPPPLLRDRVLAAVRPPQPAKSSDLPVRRSPAVYALAGLCAALVAVCLWLGTSRGKLESTLLAVTEERNGLEAALKSLSRSGTRTIQFGKANQPEGRVFVNPSGGLVFVASRLPRLASDRTFQLWLVPPQGAPRSAGLFRPDADGASVTVSNVNVDPAATKAVAVSVEPSAGSAAPTTTPIIVAALE